MNRFVQFVKDASKGVFKLRSPHWHAVRNDFLKKNPQCAACGETDNLQAHHVFPFHLDPARELDETNLITLCEEPDSHCHLHVGHLGSWRNYNPRVVQDAEAFVRKRS